MIEWFYYRQGQVISIGLCIKGNKHSLLIGLFGVIHSIMMICEVVALLVHHSSNDFFSLFCLESKIFFKTYNVMYQSVLTLNRKTEYSEMESSVQLRAVTSELMVLFIRT